MNELVIKYSCLRCRTTQREVSVPARAQETDILDWMPTVIARVTKDHHEFAPYCHSLAVDLMVPLPSTEDGRIGQAL